MTTLETVRVDLAPLAQPGYATHSTPLALVPVPQKRTTREVRFGSYILGNTLGEGEFGKVKLGWRKDGTQPLQVAIKLIKRDSLARDPELEIKIHREINLLKMLSHPNIVNLVEVMKLGKYIGIVLEYCSSGELFDYILNHKYLKESVAKKLFAQLVLGVDYMHSKGLVHRDLKLENLLLDKHKNVIISDFGFVNSYRENDLMKTSCGLPCYAAPELVLSQLRYHGRKVDIWSLGVILYAMLAGYLPFDDDPENEDGLDIVRLYQYICKTPLTFPEYVSPLARDLLRKIIVPDPKKRVDMDQIIAHPWLQQHANLLLIRNVEWDRLAHERAQPAAPLPAAAAPRSKRFSMVQELTTSLLLTAAPRAAMLTTSLSFALAVAPRPVLVSASPAQQQQNQQQQIGADASPFTRVPLPRATHTRLTLVATPIIEVEPTSLMLPTPKPITPSSVVANGGHLLAPEPQVSVKAGNFSPANTARLPHQKPRPTLYHPSLLSLSLLTDLYKTPLSTSPTKAPPLSQTTDENALPERSPKSKRNSVMVYLEDKIEQLDLRDAVPPSATEAPPPVPAKEPIKPPPVPPKDRKRAPISNGFLMSGTNGPLTTNPPQQRPVLMAVPPLALAPSTMPKRTHSVSGRRVTLDDDKENKRKNRFLLLSFYSGYSSLSTLISAIVRDDEKHAPAKDTPVVATPAKRPLEPLSDHNINTTAKRNVLALLTGSKRLTVSTALSVQGKEALAARKVMDFFKRRSIRG